MNYQSPLRLFVIVAALSLFTGISQAQTTATWIGPDNGSWSDPENWDIGVAPNNTDTETYEVVIDLETSSPYRVHSALNTTVDSLTLDSDDATYSPGFNSRIEGVLDVIRGGLRINGSHNSPLRFNAGEIRLNGNTFETSHAVIERALVRDFSLSDGPTVFEQGASVTGGVRLRNAALRFRGDSNQTNDVAINDARIRLIGSSLSAYEDVDLTLSSDSWVRGYGDIGNGLHTSNFTNEGLIDANVGGQSLRINTGYAVVYSGQEAPELGRFVNRGTMRVRNGSKLDLFRPISSSLHYGQFFNDVDGKILIEKDSELYLGRDWSSRGTIDVRRGGVLTIDSDFTTADIKTVIPRVGSTVKVGALWDNEGQTYTFGNRAKAFEFDRALIRGGIINADAHPLNIRGSLAFEDVFVRSDIVLDAIGESVVFSGGRLIGDVSILEQARVTTSGTNFSSVESVKLDHWLATLDIGSEDEDIRWHQSQTIEGEGRVLANDDGQSFRNFGTIRANVADRRLYLGSAGTAGDFIVNRGVMEATEGGKLAIGFGEGKFINGSDGLIRAGVNSTVAMWNSGGKFVNRGTFELLAGSTLQLGGNYDQSFFTGITADQSAMISLEGRLKLSEGERFTPSGNFAFSDTSSVLGGELDLTAIANRISGTFEDTIIDSDLIVGSGATVGLWGNTVVSGKTVLNGASLSVRDDSYLAGDVEIRDGAHLTAQGDKHFKDNVKVLVDGPDSVFSTEGILSALEINLSGGGQIQQSSSSSFEFEAGTTVSGSGKIIENQFANPWQGIANRGTISATGSGQRMEIIGQSTSRNNFRNLGTVSARNGGEITFANEAYHQYVGSQLILDNGVLSSDDGIVMWDGKVLGNGRLEAPNLYLRGGELSPGFGSGHLEISGDVFVGPMNFFADVTEMELVFDIAGVEQGAAEGYDLLTIDGDMSILPIYNPDDLGSYLRIRTSDDVVIDDLAGFEFSIIELTDSHEISGAFWNIDNGGLLTTVDERFQFNVFYGADSDYGANRVVLTNFSLFGGGGSITAVPEPSALLLFAFASTVIATRRKRSLA